MNIFDVRDSNVVKSMAIIGFLSLLISAFPVPFLTANAVSTTVLFEEDFETLPLGVTVDSSWNVQVTGGNDDSEKVTICHATASEQNPYVQQTVNSNAITNPGGHGNSGINANDIIPPFDGYAGQNWTEENQTIWNNDCSVPPLDEPTPSVPLTICKYHGIEDTLLGGWDISVSNGDSTDIYTTVEGECIETAVNPFLGPWTVTEEMQEGWEQVDVSASGPGSSEEAVSEESRTLMCSFAAPLPAEPEVLTTALAVVAAPEWRCDFYNQPVVSEVVTVCKVDEFENPVSGWEMTLVTDTEEVLEALTGDNGCVDFVVPSNQFPVTVHEEMQEGWEQINILAEGGSVHLDKKSGELSCRLGEVEVTDGDEIELFAKIKQPSYQCWFMNEEIEEPTPTQCVVPNTLGDTAPFVLLDSGEKTIGEIFAEHGYGAVDVLADQMNYQVWDITDPTAETVTFNVRVLGKLAGNTQVLGYYKAGDGSTFTTLLTQAADTDGELAIPVTIPAAFADSFGFAIISGDNTWYSEIALNSDGEDHVAVYQPSPNTYLLAFEDLPNLGDGDYNDLVIEVSEVGCTRASGGGNGSGTNGGNDDEDDTTPQITRSGGGGGGGTRVDRGNTPEPLIAGAAISLDGETEPSPMVLGDQVSAVPYGGAAAGAGGTAIPSIPAILPLLGFLALFAAARFERGR